MDSLVNTHSLPEFFKERVDLAISHLRIRVSPDAEFYLVNLLTSFSQTEKLFEVNDKGELVDQALAYQFFESLTSPREKRIPLLKKMGDVSLYISGFFSDSLFKKLLDLNYYRQMGHTAYSSLSNILPENPRGSDLKGLYDELAHNFNAFVDLISQVADSTSLKSDQSILKLYERWLATGSERARELLCNQGIIPNGLAKTKFAN